MRERKSTAPLLISEDDVRNVLTMRHCLDALESAFKQEGLERAVNRVKATIYTHPEPGGVVQYVSMEGGLNNPPVFCLRVSLRPSLPHGGPRGAGTVMLFSGENGQLLGIFQTRELSSLRVGGTAGLAAREMARPDAKVVGILGSGGLARAHALAYAQVRKVELFKVFSPNPEHRQAFGAWITEKTGIPVKVCDDPEPVVRGSDIVAACTNTRAPIVKPEWLDQPGVHMTGVQLGDQQELEPEGRKLFHRLVTYLPDVSTHLTTDPDRPLWSSATTPDSLARLHVIPNRHKLTDVLLGRAPGRVSLGERNYHFSEGSGVQFAALSAAAYQRALECGVGRELPEEVADWFSPAKHT